MLQVECGQTIDPEMVDATSGGTDFIRGNTIEELLREGQEHVVLFADCPLRPGDDSFWVNLQPVPLDFKKLKLAVRRSVEEAKNMLLNAPNYTCNHWGTSECPLGRIKK